MARSRVPSADLDPNASVGLRRGTVLLRAHDPAWREAYEVQRGRLREAAGAIAADIEHVGSTAVPGLAAKPIIDIALSLDSLDRIPALSERVASIGAIDRGFINERRDDYLFVFESAPEIRTHHVHVVARGSRAWDEYILFRDRLRGDAEFKARYARLKQTLSAGPGVDRRAYTRAKAPFIAQACRGG